MRNFSFSLWVVVLVFSCTEIESVTREYPRVRTIGLTEVNNNSLKVRGEIISTSGQIIDHGFVWSKKADSPVNIYSDFKLSIGATSDLGVFESEIDGLQSGVKYYIKAYAKSSDYTVYGEVLEFIL